MTKQPKAPQGYPAGRKPGEIKRPRNPAIPSPDAGVRPPKK